MAFSYCQRQSLQIVLMHLPWNSEVFFEVRIMLLSVIVSFFNRYLLNNLFYTQLHTHTYIFSIYVGGIVGVGKCVPAHLTRPLCLYMCETSWHVYIVNKTLLKTISCWFLIRMFRRIVAWNGKRKTTFRSWPARTSPSRWSRRRQRMSKDPADNF